MRVLEFANNPAAKIKMTRLHELQELKDENEALLQALSELEDAKGLSNDEGDNQGQEDGTARRYVPRQSFDRLVKEKKDLEESREKRVLRLKEVSITTQTKVDPTNVRAHALDHEPDIPDLRRQIQRIPRSSLLSPRVED
jgi:hypothetical protein